jgi:hypothetical protein
VIVAVYVPAGVPDILVVGDEPPPHPATPRNNTAIIGIANPAPRRRNTTNNKPEASRSNAVVVGAIPFGKLACEMDPAVPAAVLDIFTIAEAAVPGVTLTDAGTVQIGSDVTAGAIVQLKLTVPANDPVGVTARSKDAVCPGVIVAEFEDPEASPMEKPAAAVPVPDNATA